MTHGGLCYLRLSTLLLTESDPSLQVLVDSKASDLKKADHKYAIQRELDAVRKLQVMRRMRPLKAIIHSDSVKTTLPYRYRA